MTNEEIYQKLIEAKIIQDGACYVVTQRIEDEGLKLELLEKLDAVSDKLDEIVFAVSPPAEG